MADYYGLLARAVQALRRNDKSSRLEIYAKARHALIRQLKAINPPLPPEEISKQRLALEEAIRRVEREAAEAAAAAMLSEEEIGRQAERALEEALADDPAFGGQAVDESLDEYATDPYADPMEEPPPRAYRPPPVQPRSAPSQERAYRPPPDERAYAPEPRAYQPEPRAYRQPPEERAYQPEPRAYRQPPEERGYSPPPMPEERVNYRQMDERAYEPQRRQPEPEGRVQFEPPPRQTYRPEPEVMPPADNYADPRKNGRTEEAYAEVVTPARPQAPERNPGASTWNRAATVTDVEQQPAVSKPSRTVKQAERAARSKRGGRGWERTQSHGKKKKWSTSARLAVAAVVLIAVAGAGYYAWTDWDNVSTYVTELITGKSEPVEIIAQEVVDPATGEPVAFTEPAAYYYEEPTADGVSAKYDATVVWSLVEDATLGPVVSAHIEVPRRGLTFDMQVAEGTVPTASHELTVSTTVGRNGPALQGVDNVSVKTSEEAIGIELEGAVESEPNLYVIDLPAESARINNNRFATSPWFDIALVYETGQRAVLAFSKGTVAAGYFTQAIEAWDAAN